MISILFNEKELLKFKEVTAQAKLEYEIIESQKLGGEEIIFQLIITAVGIGAPYIVDWFREKGNDNKGITLVKDGIKIKFEKEEDLRKFLEENSK